MLRIFLKLFFKSKLNKIFSYICIGLILAFLIERIGNIFFIHPFTLISFIIGFVIFLFISIGVKEKRICTALDTKINQKKYCDETRLEASKNGKLKAGYRKWLISTIIENNQDIEDTQFFIGFTTYYCLYCCFSIVPIVILSILLNIYWTLPQTFVIILVVVISIITLCIISDRRTTNMRYKHLDSDIKRILFEEETGYSPLVNGKFSFKYKAWLKSSDEKIHTVPFRN